MVSYFETLFPTSISRGLIKLFILLKLERDIFWPSCQVIDSLFFFLLLNFTSCLCYTWFLRILFYMIWIEMLPILSNFLVEKFLFDGNFDILDVSSGLKKRTVISSTKMYEHFFLLLDWRSEVGLDVC